MSANGVEMGTIVFSSEIFSLMEFFRKSVTCRGEEKFGIVLA